MVIGSDALLLELNDIRRRTSLLLNNLTSEQLIRRPEPGSWSIAECLSHLNKSAALIQPKVAAAVEQGKKDKIFGQGPFSPGALGRLLIWIAEPPPKFRIRAPKQIAPQVADGDPADVIGQFMKFQDEWERLIREGEGLDQKKVKVESPAPRLPRLRLAAPIPWMLAHQRRHLEQAETVKRLLLRKPAGA